MSKIFEVKTTAVRYVRKRCHEVRCLTRNQVKMIRTAKDLGFKVTYARVYLQEDWRIKIVLKPLNLKQFRVYEGGPNSRMRKRRLATQQVGSKFPIAQKCADGELNPGRSVGNAPLYHSTTSA